MTRLNDLGLLLQSVPNLDPAPHGNNLTHKLASYYRQRADCAAALDRIVPAYVGFRRRLSTPNAWGEGLVDTVAALDGYLTLCRTAEDVFPSQGDLTTSALPEFFLSAFGQMTRQIDAPFTASGQRDIFIDITLDVLHPGRIVPRKQRVDVAVLEPLDMQIAGQPVVGFAIPVIACEVKTYFDKNMISGVAFSFDGLKSTFPGCLCLAISEFADFAPDHQSYAAAAIDEIYILRQQRRSAWRKSGVAAPINPELVAGILRLAEEYVSKLSTPRPDLHQRLPSGSLIRHGARV